jgi:hypothetical protein
MVSMLRSSIEMSKQAALKKAKELASSAPVVVFRFYYHHNLQLQNSLFISLDGYGVI